MTPARLYLSTAEAADLLGKNTRMAFYKFCERQKAAGRPLKRYRVGRHLRFKRSDIERLIEPERVPA
jgi:excisionase family DNA binding protein